MKKHIIRRSKVSPTLATVVITADLKPGQLSVLEDIFFEAGYILSPIESWAFTISTGCEERDLKMRAYPAIETAVFSKIAEIIDSYIKFDNEL